MWLSGLTLWGQHSKRMCKTGSASQVNVKQKGKTFTQLLLNERGTVFHKEVMYTAVRSAFEWILSGLKLKLALRTT